MWKNDKEPRKVNYVWVLAGIYLFYLAGKIVIEMIKGLATINIWKILIVILFIIIGAYLCIREWKIYRFGSKDDLSCDELPESYYNNIEDNFAKEYEKTKNE